MNAFDELLDLATRNVVADHASEDAAVGALSLVAARDGGEAVAGFALLRIVDERRTVVAMEDGLVELVANRLPGSPLPTVRSA